MTQNPSALEPSDNNPGPQDGEQTPQLPGRQDTSIPAQATTVSPAEPEGTGDSLEREPNQRPHDLDFHQSEEFTGGGIKGEAEERRRHEAGSAS